MTAADPGAPPPSGRPRVLLVEDNDAASKGLSKILAAMGFEVAVVFDGASALEALRQPPPPDFVLTDLRLPDLDGREVALAASRLVPSPYIALITGWDLDHDLLESAAWGIDWVFTKPLNVHELLAKLREIVTEGATPSLPPAEPQSPPERPGST